jgi:hypothetical protein
MDRSVPPSNHLSDVTASVPLCRVVLACASLSRPPAAVGPVRSASADVQKALLYEILSLFEAADVFRYVRPRARKTKQA